MPGLDLRESTVVYDYADKTVEFYFTKESDYERCLQRNPHYMVAMRLNPGYRIVYPMDQVRKPDLLLKVSKGDP